MTFAEHCSVWKGNPCVQQLLMTFAEHCSVWKGNPNATSIIEPLRDSAPNPGESGYEGSNATVRVLSAVSPDNQLHAMLAEGAIAECLHARDAACC